MRNFETSEIALRGTLKSVIYMLLLSLIKNKKSRELETVWKNGNLENKEI